MKTRLGFVSNSSSSSFAIIVEKDNFNKVKEKLTPLEREILDFTKPKSEKAFGKDLMVISYTCGNADIFEDFCSDLALSDEDEELLENEGPSSIMDSIETKLEKFDNITIAQDI